MCNWLSGLSYKHQFFNNGCSLSKTQFDGRKQDWLVQKFGLWLLQRFNAIPWSRQKETGLVGCGNGCHLSSLRASSPGRTLWRRGREKEGELTTCRSLKFEYLCRKSRCKMLIGTCFPMFVYIPARFRLSLIGGNLTAQSTGSHRGIGGAIQIPET